MMPAKFYIYISACGCLEKPLPIYTSIQYIELGSKVQVHIGEKRCTFIQHAASIRAFCAQHQHIARPSRLERCRCTTAGPAVRASSWIPTYDVVTGPFILLGRVIYLVHSVLLRCCCTTGIWSRLNHLREVCFFLNRNISIARQTHPFLPSTNRNASKCTLTCPIQNCRCRPINSLTIQQPPSASHVHNRSTAAGAAVSPAGETRLPVLSYCCTLCFFYKQIQSSLTFKISAPTIVVFNQGRLQRYNDMRAGS